jgi:hypothetical protein
MDEQDLLWSIELVPIVSIYQIQLESIFVSLAKPQLAWGNYKRAASYTLVGQGLVLLNGTYRTIEAPGRL